MNQKYILLCFIPILLILFGILAFSVLPPKNAEHLVGTGESVLDDFWYQGKAEITSFDLQQSRYKDIHPGEVVLIQVTEDFLTDKQVKNDRYKNKNSIPILKTNLIKKFTTGLYDYSTMTSVFTSVDKGYGIKTLKTTFSSQDWCGQSFIQSNLRDGKQQYSMFSYFESEGDQKVSLDPVILEDEIFNRIRVNPDKLPQGQFKMIPSSEYQRFSHKNLSVQNVEASISEYDGNDFEGEELKQYHVRYPDIDRDLTIYYEGKAPYDIAGWKESRKSAFTGELSQTIAKRKKTILIDYWTKNDLNDTELRKKLDLDM